MEVSNKIGSRVGYHGDYSSQRVKTKVLYCIKGRYREFFCNELDIEHNIGWYNCSSDRCILELYLCKATWGTIFYFAGRNDWYSGDYNYDWG